MLIVVSPAKTLDYETPLPVDKATQPLFKKAQRRTDRSATGLHTDSAGQVDVDQ